METEDILKTAKKTMIYWNILKHIETNDILSYLVIFWSPKLEIKQELGSHKTTYLLKGKSVILGTTLSGVSSLRANWVPTGNPCAPLEDPKYQHKFEIDYLWLFGCYFGSWPAPCIFLFVLSFQPSLFPLHPKCGPSFSALDNTDDALWGHAGSLWLDMIDWYWLITRKWWPSHTITVSCLNPCLCWACPR